MESTDIDYQQALMDEIAGLPQEAFPTSCRSFGYSKRACWFKVDKPLWRFRTNLISGSGLAVKRSLNSRRDFRKRVLIKNLKGATRDQSVTLD